MMRQTLRLTALFAGYAALGAAGDLAAASFLDDSVPVRVALEFEGPAADVAVASRASDRGSQECAFQIERTGAVAASASDRVVVDAGSGHLRVEGREGLSEVRVVGAVCASQESYLDALRVTVERRGGEVEVRAHYPDSRTRDRDRRGRDVAMIDLVVEVPLRAAVDIEDSSGAMEVYSVGPLTIDDSSGEILVQGVDGDLFIDDSSGEIEVRDVAGDASIDDSSGDVDVADVQGIVRVRDGSGSIRVVEVERDVVVERDGSGSISVRDVRGDFRVLNDGSGGIRYSGVDGRVDIPRGKRRRGN